MWSWWMLRCRITTVPSWWHWPQVKGTLSGETGEAGSLTARMSCFPWQEAQLGASESPRFMALPCSDAACCFVSASWHAAQSTFWGGVSCGSSLPSRSVWQLTHWRLPWIEPAKAFSAT